MIKLSKRLNNFSEYIFSDLDKKIKEVELKSKRSVLNLGMGNPDVFPSSLYINKLCEFLKAEKAHLYPGFRANEEFSKALINWYKKRFDVQLEKDELLPLLGAKDGVSHLPLALLDKGDEILVPDPGYPAFSDPAKMLGAKIVNYDLTEKNDFKVSLSQLEEKVSSKTKYIWVNFPSNPTGQVATVEELKGIVNFAKKHNILIIYDNAYSEITFDGFVAPSILQIKGAKDICLEIGSFSKSFSFAGFRMGWMVGNSKIIQAVAKVKSQMDSGLSTPLQNLGAFALNNFDKDWYKDMLLSYQTRRQKIGGFLKKLDLQFKESRGGLYIWANIPSSEKDSLSFCMKILQKRQILFAPGIAFGKNGKRYIRISISANINNIERYF